MAGARRFGWLFALAAALRLAGAAPAAGQAPAARFTLPVAPPDLSVAPVRTGAIVLDGVVDEVAWASVPVLPMTQHWPDFGEDRTDRTQYRVLHDADHLWISGVFRARAEDVRGVSLYRDRWNGDDAADLFVDGRNDDVTGLFLTTTPLGVRIDAEVRNDATNSGGVLAQNSDWNGFWAARSRILPDGWSFEVRIPYETIGVERTKSGQPPTIGLILSRHHAVGEHRDIFPAIPPEWDNAHLKPSLAHDLQLPAARPGVPLFVTPYLLTGAERTRDFDAAEPSPPSTDVPLEVGADLRIGLASSLTLDLTANTDFAQAESDALQVNLDRFNLFFPEKRQFFQERAANFDFQMGPEIRLFHSRTIGLDEDGRRQRIWGGGRLTGTLAGWDVGVLSLEVDGSAGGLREHDSALRLQRALGGGRSRIGGIVTSRLRDGEAAFTLGADALLHLGGDDYLTVQAAASSSPSAKDIEAAGAGTLPAGEGATPSAAATEPHLLERTALRVFWERRSIDGFSWAAEAMRSGTSFDPLLGFEARNAVTSAVADLFYSRRPGPSSRLSRWRFIATTRGYWRTGGGSVETALQRFRTQLFFRNGFFWNTALNVTYENLTEPLSLPGATVVEGGYRGIDLFTNIDLPRSLRFGGFAILHVGTMFDGWRTDLTVGPRLNFSRHLTVQPELQVRRLHFPERAETVRADGAGLRVQAALDTRWSAETFLQYNRAAERVAANVRLRYHGGEGRDVFLVYEGVRDLEDALDPARRALGRTDGRLLLKVTHTMRW